MPPTHRAPLRNGLGPLVFALLLLSTPLARAQEAWLRDRLEWFRDLKFGLLITWGAYSQWGCIESWPLVEEETWSRPDDEPAWVERDRDFARFQRDYWDLPRTFDPVAFDPREWARTARGAGMKYVVLVTKHCDGFSLFDTRLTDYRITSPTVPFHSHSRSNVVREVFHAFRREGMGIGVYYPKADWHSPHYWRPGAPARTIGPNYDPLAQPDSWRKYVEFVHGQIEELMTGYGPVDLLWLDCFWVRPPAQDLDLDRLVTTARRDQPGLIVVDRAAFGRHENVLTPENVVPPEPLPQPWETALSIGEYWSYKPTSKIRPAWSLVHLLVEIVAKGGNLLLNVGPQPDGRFPAVAVAELNQVGDWLEINGEALYGSRQADPYRSGNVFFTRRGPIRHAILLAEPPEAPLPARVSWKGHRPKPGSTLRLLGSDRSLPWESVENTTTVEVPEDLRTSPPSRHAYAFRFEAPAD